ncbi:hypothetical protein V1511DRAFT_508600 [Dipodascopsis uninucleata]
MAAPRSIPGFYYDEEKRKYFQILSTGAGGGSSSFYTSERVNKRMKSSQRNETSKKENRTKRGGCRDIQYMDSLTTVINTTICHQPLHYRMPIMSRIRQVTELGSFSRRASVASAVEMEIKMFAAGLQHSSTLWGSARTDLVGVTCMDIRKDLHGTHRIWIGDAQGIYKEYRALRCLREPSYSVDMSTPFAEFNGPVTSISKSDSLGVITASTEGSHDINAMLWIPTSSSPISVMYKIHKFRVDTDARCSALSQDCQKFAIGGSNRIFAYTAGPNERRLSETYKLQSDVFALESISSHTFLAGLRDGSVRVFDIRVPAHVGQTLTTILHPSAITKMKRLKESYMIVSGLRDSLALYDLRFAKLYEASMLSANGHYQRYSPNNKKTSVTKKSRPVLAYSGYSNEYIFDHGFDVSIDDRILAIADQSHSVKLYSIWDGLQLQVRLTNTVFKTLPRAVKWSNVRLEKYSNPEYIADSLPQGLLITNGRRLDYWSWDGSEEVSF